MGRILDRGGAMVLRVGGSEGPLCADTVRRLALGGGPIFCDLSVNGLRLCSLLQSYLGRLPRTHVYGLEMYYVAFGDCVIKNSRMFKLDLTLGDAEFARDVSDIRHIC